MTAPQHVLLIDGSGFIFRAYFARAKSARFQRRSDGEATEVVTLFSSMLDKYLQSASADHIAVVLDSRGRGFRHELYDQYKANRKEKPADLIPQLAHVRQAVSAFGVCRVEKENFEADDLIATYARHAVAAGAKVTILSSDKDMMQLVADGSVMIRDPMTDRLIGEAEVREKFGVGPDQVVEVQALCGDAADNVPGVPGIGLKTAAELINSFGDLETLIARAAEIKSPRRRWTLLENQAIARLSRKLVKLDADVPMPCPLSALRVRPYDPGRLFPFLDEMELFALKERIKKRMPSRVVLTEVGQQEREMAEPTDAEIDKLDAAVNDLRRSQGLLAAVLGPEEAENPRAVIGGNQPPEPIEPSLPPEDVRIAALIADATKWAELYPTIETTDVAAAKAAADWIDQLDAQWAEYDDRRKAEREVHNLALKAIQDLWLPRLDRLDICRKDIRPRHKDWLRRDDARVKAERAAAEKEAAEAQRRADQLAEQAKAGGAASVPTAILALEATQEAEQKRATARKAPTHSQVRGNLGGRTHSLRTVWSAMVVDQDKLYRHFRDHPNVRALLKSLADEAARSGIRNPNLPGCWVDSEEK